MLCGRKPAAGFSRKGYRHFMERMRAFFQFFALISHFPRMDLGAKAGEWMTSLERIVIFRLKMFFIFLC
ncbi:MAG TPA: hypothetical protein DDZ04_03440 [Parabacteroides sp.]|nr:hypothetical protein [Parabacteroides sp.]